MDDELEFPRIKNDKILYGLAKKNEEDLIYRSDLVICSSEYLKQKLQLRYSELKKIFVINNATNSFKKNTFTIRSSVNQQFSALENIFLYVGTISSWFDFDSVILMLENNQNANFVLVGPCDVFIPLHPRLHYFGAIERESLPFFIQKSIALTMPFLLNELIRSVDPVKIYEYIGSNKPIIATNYTEMTKFSKFCYLYDDSIGFSDIASKILNGKIIYNVNSSEVNRFIDKNTWEQRGLEIEGLITKLIQNKNGE
jgi:glycosyltransferase involved in cell wall biosynthesis